MRNYDISPLLRQWIGFDKLASSMQGSDQAFPPYNIEKSDDNHYRISLALAGFKQNDLTAVGRGSSQPFVPNTSDENHASNRRVAVIIIP